MVGRPVGEITRQEWRELLVRARRACGHASRLRQESEEARSWGVEARILGDETDALRGAASTDGDGGDVKVRAQTVTAQVVKS
jgi:hypothetical protein